MATAPLTHAPRSRNRHNGETADTEWTRLLHYRVRVNDRLAYERQQRNVFRRGIYHFESSRPDPRIIDFGCGVGISILYFKHVYPTARIAAFEPNSTARSCLLANLEQNALTDVTIVGPVSSGTSHEIASWGESLAECLSEPVDFLKITLGGAEWDALNPCSNRLRRVRTMAIEYHHRPGAARSLHRILERLDDLDFDYLVGTPDSHDNTDLQPPYWLTPATRYTLLVHAAQRDPVTPS